MLQSLLYNLGIWLYTTAIRLAAPFNKKADLWIAGRKNWRDKLRNKIAQLPDGPRIWVHCASLGEFEQGRPIIETIKKDHPNHNIILSFFSPSGYEIRKDYEQADVVCYMPADSVQNAKDFLDIVKPQTALFIKYEFWANFLEQLRLKQIDTYLISGVFKEHQPFFKWYGKTFRTSLAAFKTLFVQDEHSVNLLHKIGIDNVVVCGDTRFDRVLEIKNNFKPLPEIAAFKGNSKLIIAGSTWPKDEALVIDAFCKIKEDGIKLLLVPHDIESKLLQHTVAKLKKAALSYSLYTEGVKPDADVLVLNTVGLLSKIYHYADVAYIGGGFNGGLHNCLEAAVFLKPVSFYGEEYRNYVEVVGLVNIGAAKSVRDDTALAAAWRGYLFEEKTIQETADRLELFFQDNMNASKKILSLIKL